jgi:hypothetical protein
MKHFISKLPVAVLILIKWIYSVVPSTCNYYVHLVWNISTVLMGKESCFIEGLGTSVEIYAHHCARKCKRALQKWKQTVCLHQRSSRDNLLMVNHDYYLLTECVQESVQKKKIFSFYVRELLFSHIWPK